MTQSARRNWLSRILLILLLFLLVAIVINGAYLFLKFRDHQPTASDEFSHQPYLNKNFLPNDYGLKVFQPIWGAGNSVAPVSYGEEQVLAGENQEGKTVLVSIDQSGNAKWETNLGAKLVACSKAALVDPKSNDQISKIACLLSEQKSSTLALVDLQSGKTDWIWMAPEIYLNVAIYKQEIWLMKNDFSLTHLTQSGVSASPTLLSQSGSDPALHPNLDQCDLPKTGTMDTPETMEFFSDSSLLLSHNGINYFIDPSINEIKGAFPGQITRSKNNEVLAVSNLTGCAPSYRVIPSRNWISRLPDGVSIPVNLAGGLSTLVVQDNKIHKIRWESQGLSRSLFRDSNLNFGSDTKIYSFAGKLYIASNGQLARINEKTGTLDWSINDQVVTFHLFKDSLVYLTNKGDIKAVSANEGIEMWKIRNLQAQEMTSISTPASIQTFSTQAIRLFVPTSEQKKSVTHGQAAPEIQKAQPGVNYSENECVVITLPESPTSDTYPVDYQPTSCDAPNARRIVKVIPSSEIPRGEDPQKLYSYCNPKFEANSQKPGNSGDLTSPSGVPPIITGPPAPGSPRSVITTNSPIVNPEISGLCLD